MRRDRPFDPVVLWTLIISVLVTTGSLVGLLDPSGVYGRETKNWAAQARGQDLGNLVAIATLLVSARMHHKGSFRASLVWVGTLFYLVYAYTVYAMALHFNGLFLVYVAVLGTSSYALLFSIGRFQSRVTMLGPDWQARRLAGYTLVSIAVLFSLMWLSEVVPATLSSAVPQSVVDAGLWVNPIHVIDLALVLPAFLVTGYLTLRERPPGPFLAGPWLVFCVLMGVSIVAAMILMGLTGFEDVVPPMVFVSAVVVASAVAAWRYLAQVR